MNTTCEGCGAFVTERTWDRERSFVETYACGSRHRWGEGPEQLEPCPIQHAKETGAAMERASVLTWLRERAAEHRQQAQSARVSDGKLLELMAALYEFVAAPIERGEHVKEQP